MRLQDFGTDPFFPKSLLEVVINNFLTNLTIKFDFLLILQVERRSISNAKYAFMLAASASFEKQTLTVIIFNMLPYYHWLKSNESKPSTNFATIHTFITSKFG